MPKKQIVLGLERIDKPSFAAHFRLGRFRTPRHVHLRHSLTYAEDGVIYVELDCRSFLLPARHALWMPAGIPHRNYSNSPNLVVRSLFFDPAADAVSNTLLPNDLAVFPVTTLAREMILYTEHWNYDYPLTEAEAAFFAAIRALIPAWCAQPLALVLPVSQDRLLADIGRYLRDHLDEPLPAGTVARQFAMSSRTLLRMFKKEFGMTYQQYLRIARVIRSLELLVDGNASVTEVALEVGYASLSAYSQTFKALTGHNPSEFKQIMT